MPDGFFLIACALVVAGHVVPSWPGIREALIARLGRGRFGALHGIGSTVTLALLVVAYRHQESTIPWFTPMPGAVHALVAGMPVAFVLVAWGLLRTSRTLAGSGVMLWAMLHILATGDGVRVVLFASLGLIGVFSLLRDRLAPLAPRKPPRGRLTVAVLGGLAAYGVMLVWLHPWLFGVAPLALMP